VSYQRICLLRIGLKGAKCLLALHNLELVYLLALAWEGIDLLVKIWLLSTVVGLFRKLVVVITCSGITLTPLTCNLSR
jgi:hypothetical protein